MIIHQIFTPNKKNQFFFFYESVHSVHKTSLNDSFTNQTGPRSSSAHRLNDPVTAVNSSQEVKNDSNFNLFLTQSYRMASEDLKYGTHVVQTTFMVHPV